MPKYLQIIVNHTHSSILLFDTATHAWASVATFLIANTSMDACLSMVMANLGQVKDNDMVLDPFVGSGEIIIGHLFKSKISLKE